MPPRGKKRRARAPKSISEDPGQVENAEIGQTDQPQPEPCEENEKVKKEKHHALLSEAEEESMVEWLRTHEEIYNKKLKSLLLLSLLLVTCQQPETQ